MSSTSKHHQELTNGVGKCSVPMWCNGIPAGFCEHVAYGERPPSRTFLNRRTGEMQREDGRYNGYVPRLACPAHGGPQHPDYGTPNYCSVCSPKGLGYCRCEIASNE